MAMLMSDVLLAANPKRGLGANDDIKITVCAPVVDCSCLFYTLLYLFCFPFVSEALSGFMDTTHTVEYTPCGYSLPFNVAGIQMQTKAP